MVLSFPIIINSSNVFMPTDQLDPKRLGIQAIEREYFAQLFVVVMNIHCLRYTHTHTRIGVIALSKVSDVVVRIALLMLAHVSSLLYSMPLIHPSMIVVDK